MNNGKLAVVGDKQSITAFKACGMDIFPAETAAQITDVLRELIKSDYIVILITEKAARLVGGILEKLKERPYPIVVPIPSSEGASGYGMECIKKDVERAIGADVLFNKD